jgi:mono/diheme cytochrome c family protein
LTEPAVIARGKAVYLTYCAQCHGFNHDGNGTVGQSFQPLPFDLRSSQIQYKPAGVLFKSISYGIPGGRQPALHTTVTVDDRWCVVAYIKSLGLR